MKGYISDQQDSSTAHEFATKPNDLSSISRSHRVEKTNAYRLSSDFYMCTAVYTHSHTHKKKIGGKERKKKPTYCIILTSRCSNYGILTTAEFPSWERKIKLNQEV